MTTTLRLAIPSTGALYDGTGQLLESSDASVSRVNTRRYTAEMPSIPGIEVIYQRQSDITSIVDSGNADIGILGLDRYLESRLEDGSSLVIAPDLGFGTSRLCIAVPEVWENTTTIWDLADIALEFHERGSPIRVASKYPRLVRRFLLRQGVTFFTLVDINGALEAAPRIGYADIIADISDTGNTLRENNLRTLTGGIVMESKAIMVGNGDLLGTSAEKLQLLRLLLERIEARLAARLYRRVTANVKGETEDHVARLVLKVPELAGMTGPTVSKVWTSDDDNWYAVQVVARKEDVVRVVDHLRGLGGRGAAVTVLEFIYQERCELFAALVANLSDLRNKGTIA